MEEPDEEEVVVEEETLSLGEVTFIVAIVINMVTLKVIVLKRKETPMTTQAIFSKDESENSQTLFLTCNNFDAKDDFLWYLDSGCSNHMT